MLFRHWYFRQNVVLSHRTDHKIPGLSLISTTVSHKCDVNTNAKQTKPSNDLFNGRANQACESGCSMYRCNCPFYVFGWGLAPATFNHIRSERLHCRWTVLLPRTQWSSFVAFVNQCGPIARWLWRNGQWRMSLGNVIWSIPYSSM